MSITYGEFREKLNRTIKESMRESIDRSFKPTSNRELLQRFQVGDIVESEGNIFEIVDKRSNYLLVCDESGGLHKRFVDAVKLTKEEMNYPAGTFKGLPFDSIFESCIDSATDIYALIKAIQLHNSANYPVFEAFAARHGKLFESAIGELQGKKAKMATILGSTLGLSDKLSPSETIKAAKDQWPKLVGAKKEVVRKMLDIIAPFEDVSEVHLNPDYDNEREMMGYETLKRELELATGIKGYGDLEPGDKIPDETIGVRFKKGGKEKESMGSRHAKIHHHRAE